MLSETVYTYTEAPPPGSKLYISDKAGCDNKQRGEGDLVGFILRLAVGFRFTKFPMIRDDMLLGC